MDVRETSYLITATDIRESRISFVDDWTEQLGAYEGKLLFIADARLAEWTSRMASHFHPLATLRLEVSEAQKHVDTLQVVYEWLARQETTRDSVIVAFGGGVLTDLVGYAAATYLRGLRWIAIPTTLLAQVDAAIGGKVAVNTAYGKNLLGAFHLPDCVLIDPQFLTTLPLREWQAGVGEILKSGLIQGGPLYETMMTLSLPASTGTRCEVSAVWRDVIRQTAKIKIDVVNQDLFESGPRMYLNFGHTVGHALENLLGYGTLTHGEAVGIGSLVALALSEIKLGLSSAVRQSTRETMVRWGMPTTVPEVSFDALWQQLHRDKKARQSSLTWVLLEELGHPQLNRAVQGRDLLEALRIVSDA